MPVPDGPPPPLDVLAVEGQREGVLGEGLAAAIVRRAAGRAREPVAGHLRAIARDEAEHARFAARVVAWAEGAGGERVRRAVAAVRPPAFAPRPEPAGALAVAWGRAGADVQADARAEVAVRRA